MSTPDELPFEREGDEKMKAVNSARKEQKWSRTNVKALLLSLVILLMLPQLGGALRRKSRGRLCRSR